MTLDKTLTFSLAQGHRLQREEKDNEKDDQEKNYQDVLLYPEGLVELNQSSAEILKRCNGKHLFDEIVNELEQQFNVQGITDDVEEFLQEALNNGWITQP